MSDMFLPAAKMQMFEDGTKKYMWAHRLVKEQRFNRLREVEVFSVTKAISQHEG